MDIGKEVREVEFEPVEVPNQEPVTVPVPVPDRELEPAT